MEFDLLALAGKKGAWVYLKVAVEYQRLMAVFVVEEEEWKVEVEDPREEVVLEYWIIAD